MQPLKLDHGVVTVTDGVRSNAFYAPVLGADPRRIPAGAGWAYRVGGAQLNVHGPSQAGEPNPQ